MKEKLYLEQYEEDRHSLIHKIVFNASIEKWENVDKYKKLYLEIYGPFEIDTTHKLNTSETILPLFLGRSK